MALKERAGLVDRSRSDIALAIADVLYGAYGGDKTAGSNERIACSTMAVETTAELS